MRKRKRCPECGEMFFPDARVKNQKTCSAKACQRKRKNKNQKALRDRDPSYKERDREAICRLREQKPDYWRDWRRNHPKAVERNRQQQRERNRKRRQFREPAGEETGLVPREEGPPVTKTEKAGIAKVDSISAQVVLNQEIEPTLDEHGQWIAKVDLIFREPFQLHRLRG